MKASDKFIIFTTEAGRRFAFPCHVIAHRRALYYERDDDANYQEEYDHTVNDNSVLYEWAVSNMDWDDVAPYAVELPRLVPEENLTQQWYSGEFSDPNPPQAIGDSELCEKLYYALQECEKKEKLD
jgi:hypothetical protein